MYKELFENNTCHHMVFLVVVVVVSESIAFRVFIHLYNPDSAT